MKLFDVNDENVSTSFSMKMFKAFQSAKHILYQTPCESVYNTVKKWTKINTEHIPYRSVDTKTTKCNTDFSDTNPCGL